MKTRRGKREKAQMQKRNFFRFQPFSKKQKMILSWWTGDSPVKDKSGIIADGAIRSGKTLCMSLSFTLWAMQTYDGQNFGMAGKTIASFRRNVLRSLVLMLKSRGYTVIDHRADNLVTVSKGGKENYFYIFGGKDESSQDLIQGITLAGLFLDEVALMPESFVSQATGRCSVEGSKFWFNCNPGGPLHWFKTGWIDKKKEKDLLYLHFTMVDNLSLSQDIVKRYQQMYTGVFYRRYILGLWCMAEGVIYDMFDRKKHVKQFPAGQKPIKSYVSCDYGTQNATCFLLWQQAPGGVWYCTREYYYSGRDQKRQKTDRKFADDYLTWIGKDRPAAFILDPAAASFAAELRERGVPVQRAINDVSDGIRVTAAEMEAGNYYICPDCKNLISEIQQYAWDPKAAKRGEDQPIKVRDHACDAMRYFVYTVLGGRQAKFNDTSRI